MERGTRDRKPVFRKPRLSECLHEIGRGPAHDIFLRDELDSPDGYHPSNDEAAYRDARQNQCSVSREKFPGSLQQAAHHDQETQSPEAGDPKFRFEQ